MKSRKMTVDEARKMLGLGEAATIGEIKDAYRKLAVKYHPDKCLGEGKTENEEFFKKINEANETLMIYCLNYRFSLNDDNTKEAKMDKENHEHMKRFYDGWWGDLG